MSIKHVGFIGLGNIGKPMAINLANSDFVTHVYDVNPKACEELKQCGASVETSPAGLAKHCQIIGLCVRDDDDVNEVVLGDKGLLKTAQQGTIIAIHSTVMQPTILALAKICEEKAIHLLDVPITGGAHGAANKALCYLFGGPENLMSRCLPVFQTSSEKVIYAGGIGAGMALKLCNNLMTWSSFLAMHEGLKLAEASGLSLDKLKEVSESNGVMNSQMITFIEGRGKAQAEMSLEDFKTNSIYAGYSALGEKDLGAALDLAKHVGVELPGVARNITLIRSVLLNDQ